jgi:hypothetical protein
MPDWPSQNKSLATTAEPVVPKSLAVEPSARRTDKPRHFSVNNMAPSGVKAISHGLLSPDIKSVRTKVGAAKDVASPWFGDAAASRACGERFWKQALVATRITMLIKNMNLLGKVHLQLKSA